MHYTGTIWRPPYESGSLLLEATAGCTHHRCKFCTLYDELPFHFRLSPWRTLRRIWPRPRSCSGDSSYSGSFWWGANPFALQTERLKAIAGRIRKYFPECRTIGCFARVTDVGRKTDEALRELRRLGYDGLTIGVETGYDPALLFMDKGYQARDIVEQAHRLDEAGIAYHFFYLAGIAGAGRGEAAALASASVFNQTSSRILGSSMLTVYPQSRLFSEMQAGRWTEAGGSGEAGGAENPGGAPGAAPLFCGPGSVQRGFGSRLSAGGAGRRGRQAGAGLPPGARGRPAPLPGRSAASVVEIILEKHIGIV